MFTHKDLIYHRGRHGEIPIRYSAITVPIRENSIPAFVRAKDEGATMVEFDARKGPVPNVPVIAHDPGNLQAPTVIDALLALKSQVAVNIEIKDPEIVHDVIRIVDEAGSNNWNDEQFVISSFHHETIFLVKKLRPMLKVGIIMDGVPCLSYLDTLAHHRIDNLHMEYMNADMDMQNDRVFMKRAKALGMHVWVWTVNDLATAKRVYDWGAERIFTDRPDLFR